MGRGRNACVLYIFLQNEQGLYRLPGLYRDTNGQLNTDRWVEIDKYPLVEVGRKGEVVRAL